MNPAHQVANQALAELNTEIQKHESALRRLHRCRAGRVQWLKDDTADFGWCVLCGRVPVDPKQGIDTCETCRATS